MLSGACLYTAVWARFCISAMRTQVGRRVVLIQPGRFLHPFEERAHAADVETRLLEKLKADSVGLAFEITSVVELRLNAACSCTGYDRLRQVRTGARGQNAQNHRHKSGNRGLFLFSQKTGDVVLGHVSHLV